MAEREPPSEEEEKVAYERWVEKVWSPPECVPPLWKDLSDHLKHGWVE